MGICSFCKKCCICCKCPKKTNGNALSTKVSSAARLSIFAVSASDHKIFSQENFQMSLQEIEAHYKDIKNIYAYAVGAMKNFLGTPHYPYITQPKQLYPYILFLCEGLEAHEYVSIKEMISEKQFENIQLTVVIKDARVIQPKMTDFSQLFCKLWITKENDQLTSVKDAASYLLWEETFILDVTDYESDIFHVEVWSFHPELFGSINSHHLERFKENDPLAEEKGIYFIGDAFEYVKSLPCVGQNVLWTLKRGPRRVYTKGQINIYIELGVKKGFDFLLHLYCHMALIRLCYEKQVLTNEESNGLWKNWLEILPNTALTLIQQHALQHGIVPIEQGLCSWLVTSSLKMRHEDRISFYLIKDLLEYLLRNVNEVEMEEMKDMLGRSISDFSAFSLDMLRNLHTNFDIQKTEIADELFYMLRCMSTAEIKLFTNYMDSFEVIEEEASEWYVKVIRDLKNVLKNDDSVDKLSDGLANIMKMYLKNQILLDDIFMRAWDVRYSCMTYKRLDDVLCTTIQPMIRHLVVMVENPKRKRKPSESLKLLQLYHNVRNLVNYVITSMPSQRSVMLMDEYSTWFGEAIVLEWFLLCDLYTSPFIQRAVLADSMERISPKVVHGTSVPDVAAIIDEMVVDVWMKLKWKDQFYTHGALIEAAKSCAMYYSSNMFERIKAESFFCPAGDFDVSEKLCVAMSNMYAISEHLHKTNKRIKKELKIAESALGFDISRPLIDVQTDIQLMAAKFFLLVMKKVKQRTKKLIRQSFKNKRDCVNSGSAQLCLYFDSILEVLYLNLKSEAFYVTLRHMWIVVLKTLRSGLKYNQSCFIKKKKLRVFMITLQTLNQMKTIFFCDGHGLTEYELENRICEELKYAIEAKLQM